MKVKIKDTGEVVDVHWEGGLDAWLGKLDSGRFREFKERELEFLETSNIDWEQRRYEIAKELMKAFAANPNDMCVDADVARLARWSVEGTDALIAELKRCNGNGNENE